MQVTALSVHLNVNDFEEFLEKLRKTDMKNLYLFKDCSFVVILALFIRLPFDKRKIEKFKDVFNIKPNCDNTEIFKSIKNSKIKQELFFLLSIPVEKWRETSGLFYYYIVERMPEIYRAKHEFNKSIEASNIALCSAKRFSPSRQAAAGWVYYHKARTLRVMSEVENAKEYLKYAEKCFEKECLGGIRQCLLLRGILLSDESKFEEANKLFSIVEAMIERQLPTNHIDKAKFYVNQGDLYLRQSLFIQAKEKYNKALSIMRLYNLSYFINLTSKRIQYADEEIIPDMINEDFI